MRVVPAENFVQTLSVNVDNEKLTDADFRQLVRNTLPIVIGAEPKIDPVLNGSMFIRFNQRVFLTVHESEADESGSEKTWPEGAIEEVSILEDRGNTVDLQFAYGSVARGVLKSCFSVIERENS